MSKRKRVRRPKDELQREFREQLQLLRLSCKAYDSGLEAAGKHIALSIRVLVHQHGQSRSLLDQLNLSSIRFMDSAGPLNPNNVLTDCMLTIIQVSPLGGRYLPLIAGGALPRPMRAISFVNWWNNPVLKDMNRRTLCRRELVLNVADTDGGAHVDPELDEAYMAISRENSLGWEFRKGDIVRALAGRPELACMRQMAHEVFSTINSYVPEFSADASPVIPPPLGPPPDLST